MLPHLIDVVIISMLLAGIARFRAPRQARVGNMLSAAALGGALAVVLIRNPVTSVGLVMGAVAVGAVVGSAMAWRITMLQIPSMVAFQHGMGGLAALLISAIELACYGQTSASPIAGASAILGLVTGAATFSGSLVAAGKLSNRLRQTPICLPFHNGLLGGLSMLLVLLAAVGAFADDVSPASIIGLIAGSTALGVVVAIRVGGADMPVLISFLNATAGVAAACCGIAVGNRLLVACGATVAASGSILTHVMCRAMNRGLGSIFSGVSRAANDVRSGPAAVQHDPEDNSTVSEAAKADDALADPLTRAMAVLQSAESIIIIPGYGMALADAQEEVVQLADRLLGMGKQVRFAIHPVAGRMPGHMHVLLAEAEVDYGLVHDLKDINSDFAQVDLALIVGACDVVNPAALEKTGTPISGMHILRADEARDVIVCNLDERPGYSGVPNPLYSSPRTIMMLGDAKSTLHSLLAGLE